MTWRALILSAGGATGEFQIGALPVIQDRIGHFDFYTGIGVGALNSAILAQSGSLDAGVKTLTDLWSSIKGNRDIYDTPALGEAAGLASALISTQGWARDSVFGNSGLRRLIRKHVHWDALKDRDNWAIGATSLNDGCFYTITNNKPLLESRQTNGGRLSLSLDPQNAHYIGNHIHDFVAAAGSVPLYFPPTNIFGHRFVEGGLRDFAPLSLAVNAYALFLKDKPETPAEFIVVTNMPQELQFETAELLDSGQEIVFRAIQIMTSEMLRNDLMEVKHRLASLQAPEPSVIVVEPAQDFRLQPLDFDNAEKRHAMRQHGASVAAMVIAPRANRPSRPTQDEQRQVLVELVDNPEDRARARRVFETAMADPKGAREARTALRTDSRFRDLGEPEPEKDEFERNNLRMPAPFQIEEPENLHALMEIMQEAADRGKTIKALGGAYAFSNVAFTKGYLICMTSHLNQIMPVDDSVLKDPFNVMLCKFEGGATVDEINNYLWEKNKAVWNQPGYEKLTFVGAMCTGAHGSGIRLGPLSDYVRSLHLLTVNERGKVVQYQIEPTNGITDPAKFAAKYRGITLIQDDDIFHSSTVSIGCMGIIYSVTITVRDAYYLLENRIKKPWTKVREELPSLLSNPGIHSIHVWINPYKVEKQVWCVLSTYEPAEPPARGHRGLGFTLSGAEVVNDMLAWAIRTFPAAVPVLMDWALESTESQAVIMPSPEALNFGPPNKFSVFAGDCAVPADKAAEAADKLIELYQKRAEQDNLYTTSPIGLRFVQGAAAYLSPQYKQDMCMIEQPIVRDTPGARDTLTAFLDTLFDNFNGRPHWGQFNPMTKDRLRKLYPKIDKFIETYEQMNCSRLFDNAFTEQIGFQDLISRQ